MTAKEYLKQYGAIVRECNLIREQIEKVRDEYDLIAISDGGARSSSISDQTKNKALKVASLTERLSAALEERVEKEEEIFNTILKVGGIESEVLKKKYIDLKTWEQICVDMSYSWNGIHKIHRRALQKVANLI